MTDRTRARAWVSVVGEGRGLASFDRRVGVAEQAGGIGGLLLGEAGGGAESLQGERIAFDRLEQRRWLDAQGAGQGGDGLNPRHLPAGLPLADRADMHAGRLGEGAPGQVGRLAGGAKPLRVEAGRPLPATGHVSSRSSQISSDDSRCRHCQCRGQDARLAPSRTPPTGLIRYAFLTRPRDHANLLAWSRTHGMCDNASGCIAEQFGDRHVQGGGDVPESIDSRGHGAGLDVGVERADPCRHGGRAPPGRGCARPAAGGADCRGRCDEPAASGRARPPAST